MRFAEWIIVRGRELGLNTDDPTHVPAYLVMEDMAKRGDLPDNVVTAYANLLQVTPDELRRRALGEHVR
jgi:hypothetical protein